MAKSLDKICHLAENWFLFCLFENHVSFREETYFVYETIVIQQIPIID